MVRVIYQFKHLFKNHRIAENDFQKDTNKLLAENDSEKDTHKLLFIQFSIWQINSK